MINTVPELLQERPISKCFLEYWCGSEANNRREFEVRENEDDELMFRKNQIVLRFQFKSPVHHRTLLVLDGTVILYIRPDGIPSGHCIGCNINVKAIGYTGHNPRAMHTASIPMENLNLSLPSNVRKDMLPLQFMLGDDGICYGYRHFMYIFLIPGLQINIFNKCSGQHPSTNLRSKASSISHMQKQLQST